MGEEEKRMKRVMVTFDVDGTLIKSTGNSSNRLHRQAFSHAFYQVFGLKDVSIDAIQHHGQTDPLILVNTLVHYGIPSDVTGNLEEIAWMKMEGLGIQKYFTIPKFGGFGTDHTERGELIKIAANRANKLYPDGFDLRVHVGDTPNDIRAAENGGALAIGVCTGVFTAEELQKASNGNAVILPDLTNAEAFLKLLGI
ncbi:uncharacterized protein LOC110102354 isoform X3 [Dendrobium catenatum]|uniref:uncharacterized protein LOC110102354 isoform X3 n=1 Tax=Dendrobium catenatum TaxID=906689 RepID=UPI0009F257C5|nr:uncharacterized protein LOC110102354 isoform X3 [Dendrobium catenatum]